MGIEQIESHTRKVNGFTPTLTGIWYPKIGIQIFFYYIYMLTPMHSIMNADYERELSFVICIDSFFQDADDKQINRQSDLYYTFDIAYFIYISL